VRAVRNLKLTLKRLGIITIIAFLFSPLISPIPGILLAISMGFLWLSEQLNKSREDITIGEIGENIEHETINEIMDEVTPEEDKNENDVVDRGDHIVIIEKKVLKKVDLSFEDLRKYNLKNVNCIDICGAYEAEKTKNHYDEDHKHCLICKKWLNVDSINCPCCSSKLRTKEKIKEDEDIPL